MYKKKKIFFKDHYIQKDQKRLYLIEMNSHHNIIYIYLLKFIITLLFIK